MLGGHRCPACQAVPCWPFPGGRFLNGLSFSFLFLFPFLLFRFPKNTLLQELENTQKQIEEHQHDKVNAVAGSLPQ